MKDNLTTYERRENIRNYLIKKRFSTAQELSYMFGVTQRTIFRDIVFLSSRLPITTKVGGGGGIFLNQDFETPKQYLSSEEENLLIMLSETLTKKDKLIIHNILNKFSVHKGLYNPTGSLTTE